MKYKCEYLGDFNTPNGRVFSIYAQIPITYNSYKEAEKSNVFLRFKKIDSHIVLFMYENEENKSDDQCKIIDIIKWDEWWKYRVVEMKEESYNNNTSIGNEDFLPNGTNWDELFGVNNLNEDWFETVIGIENIIKKKFKEEVELNKKIFSKGKKEKNKESEVDWSKLVIGTTMSGRTSDLEFLETSKKVENNGVYKDE